MMAVSDYVSSAPHRAVLSMLRASYSGALDPSLKNDLAASDEAAVVEIATFGYLHCILSEAMRKCPIVSELLPSDLSVFFKEMAVANRARNFQILEQLRQIGSILSANDVQGLALKGAAELVAPRQGDQHFRFLSDVDILVAPEDAALVQALLLELGASPDQTAEINQSASHHMAPLRREDWPVPVEIHKALGVDRVDRVIPRESVMTDARVSQVPGLMVPNDKDRLLHLVAHAQLPTFRFDDAVLSPRDLWEYQFLSMHLTGEDREEIRARFVACELGDAFDGFVDAAEALFGGRSPMHPWSRAAFTLYGDPNRKRAKYRNRTLLHMVRGFMTSPERRRYYLKKLTEPGAVKAALTFHRDLMRRQR